MVSYDVDVIPGDGIGLDVVPESLRVLDALAADHGFRVRTTAYDYSCAYHQAHGRMMPTDGLERMRDSERHLLGAVGYPGVPDHVSLWGLMTRRFQAINATGLG